MNLTEKIDNAVKRQEASKAELYREDGSKLYSEEEHAEREEAIKQELKATMDAIEEDIDRQIASTEESLLVVENADPTDALSTEELERANAKRNFVSDEVYTLSLEALERRLRAVLAQGDRPTMFLYALYAGQRVGEGGDAARQYLDMRYEEGGVITDEAGTRGVREVVAELKRKLDPNREKKRETAQKAVEEARKLKNHAYLRRRGVRSAAELYLAGKYGAAAAR